MVRQFAASVILLVSIGLVMGIPTNTTSNTNTSDTTTADPPVETTDPVIVCTLPGEMYNECGPACGDRTCENQGRADIQCTKQCVQGCYCRNGYVRQKSTGHCVPSYRCTRVA